MATPTSRETFKEYCLRTLGKPVVDINVDDLEYQEERLKVAEQLIRSRERLNELRRQERHGNV